MLKKRILFLFPGASGVSAGGYKVVFEYANRLVADGYEVGMVYPAYCAQLNQSLFVFF